MDPLRRPLLPGELLALAVCGWPVRLTRARGWRCTAPFGHDGPHELLFFGTVVARAAGYQPPPGYAPGP